MTTIGPSHHFLRTFMKAQSSEIRPIFSRESSKAIVGEFTGGGGDPGFLIRSALRARDSVRVRG